MIDIHCHILPGIDDGPSDIRESVEMARIASDDGITTIVATPHVKDIYPAEIIRECASVLNRRLDELGIKVRILCGADVNALLDPALLKHFTVQGTNYILLEFPHTHLPKNAKTILFNMVIKGFRPIITHPERNPSIIENPELLRDLLDTNALAQITAGSLVGDFGAESRYCAEYLVERGVVSFIATDSHSTVSRPPVLTEGLKVAERIVGTVNARRMVFANPSSMVSGSLVVNVA